MTTGWRLPEGALRASVLGVNAVALLAVAAASVVVRDSLGLGSSYAIKTVIAFSGVVLLAMGFAQAFHPFSRLGPANVVTTLRMAMVAMVAGLLGEPATPAVATSAAGVSALVTMLDGVDGWVARRTGMASLFGARFDMETDALLIMVLSLLAWQLGKAGAWILLAGIMRYAFVVAGWIDARLEQPLFPSRRRQTVCVIQILGLSVVVLPAMTRPVSVWLAAGLVIVLSYSFAVDTIWLWRRE